jgi:thiol-disulfide isomerase/thioredoxin
MGSTLSPADHEYIVVRLQPSTISAAESGRSTGSAGSGDVVIAGSFVVDEVAKRCFIVDDAPGPDPSAARVAASSPRFCFRRGLFVLLTVRRLPAVIPGSRPSRAPRAVTLAFGLFVAAGAVGCSDGGTAPAEPPPSRFNGVKREASGKAAASFCEVTFPAGEQSRKFRAPSTKPLPVTLEAKKSTGGWRWVNLWATWCRPCIEEIGLLGRWQTSLQKDGVPLDLDLYSVDDDTAALTAWLQKTKMPGSVHWLAGGANDLPAVLESLGVDKGAPIPVHALVDPSGALRCVRTGSVHDEDYGAVKAIVTGG